jgi:hypothetical protein
VSLYKPLTVVFLALCSVSLTRAQKDRTGQAPADQDAADYPIKVHISATHFRACAVVGVNGNCGRGIYIDATLDEKKVELFGAVNKNGEKLILPGDYVARPRKEKPRDGGKAVLFQQYFLLLPGKLVWPCEITGFSE